MKDPKDAVNICIASDNNYAPLIATTIASVCTNTDRFVKFWCLESHISNFHKKIIDGMHRQFDNFDIEYITIDNKLLQSFSEKISTSGHISADTYSRLFIPDLFPNLEKMIYLDIDIVVTGDVGELYDINLGRYAIGAVAADYGVDKSQWFANMKMDVAHHYFNAGILLMNPKELHNDDFLNKISDIANQYGAFIKLGDQDLLNKYFNAQYLELPWRFNLTTRFIEMELAHRDPEHRLQMQEEYKNCVIRHFESPRKPWNATNNEFNGAIIKNMLDFWTAASMTPYHEWFLAQFTAAMAVKTQGAVWNASLTKNVNSNIKKKSFRLFGFLPLFSVCNKTNKTKYKLFEFIPLLSSYRRRGGTKTIYKLFNLLTVLKIKSK